MSGQAESMSDTASSIEAVDDIYNEIMYHVLGQFLVTKNNKNIATVLEDLTTEMKLIRHEIGDLSKNLKQLSFVESSFVEEAEKSSHLLSSVSPPKLSSSTEQAEDS